MSAPASFLVGSALLPAGYYCTKAALRMSKGHSFLAAIPLAFAAQQYSEGFVWIGIDRQNLPLTSGASVVYLFFAIAFWPFWIPFSVACSDPRPQVKLALGFLVILSLAWCWLYAPILMDSERWLTTSVVHHSIRYEFDNLPGFDIAPPWAWRLGYLTIVSVPLGLGALRVRERTGGLLAVMGLVGLVAAFTVSYLLFWYAFISVWCFMAALLSFALCYFFAKLAA